MAVITAPAAETILGRLVPGRQDWDVTGEMPYEQNARNGKKPTVQYLWSMKGYLWKEIDYPKKGKCKTSGVKDSQLGKSCNLGRRGQFLFSMLLFLLMLSLPAKASAAPVCVPACVDDAILASDGVVQEGGKSQASPQHIGDTSAQETVPVTPLSGTIRDNIFSDDDENVSNAPASPVSAVYVYALIVVYMVLLWCIWPCLCKQQCFQ